ncbi:MAG: trigger factor [Clostridiales bacterium]|nr:trigger factor [Clostridiales bacterium]
MRKLIQITIILAVLLLSAGFASATSEIGVSIDGAQVEFDQSSGFPFIDENNRTQVPFRKALEAFGATVDWNADTRTAIAEKDGITVQVTIGDDFIYRNDQMIMNDTISLIKDSRTYLPIRVVMEAFDASVYWDNGTKIVEVESRDTRHYNYDLSKHVTLGQYKGLEIPAEFVTVSDEEVQDEIDYWLMDAGRVDELTKGAVKSGDTVNIDFVGIMGGKPIEGGTGEGYDLTIGSGQFIPGFEEGLIGKNIGDKVVLKLTFPKDYGNELAGKRVDFNVKINSARRYVPAKLNNEFVKMYSDYNTVKEYTDYIRDYIKKEKASSAKGILWENFYASCVITDYPEKELKREISVYNQYYRDYAKSMQIEWAEFLEMNLMDQAGYDALVLEDVQNQIGLEMVLYALARQEKLELSAKEYNDGKLNYIMEMGFDSVAAYEDYYGESLERTAGGKKVIEISLIYEKVTDFMVDNATPTS